MSQERGKSFLSDELRRSVLARHAAADAIARVLGHNPGEAAVRAGHSTTISMVDAVHLAHLAFTARVPAAGGPAALAVARWEEVMDPDPTARLGGSGVHLAVTGPDGTELYAGSAGQLSGASVTMVIGAVDALLDDAGWYGDPDWRLAEFDGGQGTVAFAVHGRRADEPASVADERGLTRPAGVTVDGEAEPVGLWIDPGRVESVDGLLRLALARGELRDLAAGILASLGGEAQ